MTIANRFPHITVSREAGSGGKLIAKKLSKALNFEFYDEKLIDLVAKTVHKRRAVIAKLDESQRTILNDLVHRLLNPEYISAQTYIKSLCQVAEALAFKGGVVILGRGANFMTNSIGGLHIRVIAPFKVRVGYTVKYEKRSEKNAYFRVKKFDRERKEFVKQFFAKNPSNANYYDLVINTETLSIGKAVEIIVEAYKQKYRK